MPLPQPVYPRYRPQSFLDEAGGGTLTKALEIYAKYHPAAMQQRVYAAILEDEQWKAKDRAEQREILARERDQLTRTLSSFRETGLGPSGRAGGVGRSGAGRRAGGSGGGFGIDPLVEFAGDQAKKLVDSKSMTIDQRNEIYNQFRSSPMHEKFIQNVGRSPALQAGRTIDAARLQMAIAEEAAKLGPSLFASRQSPTQAATAATDLWNLVTSRYKNLVTITQLPDGSYKQTVTDAGMEIAGLIDEEMGTNFLTRNLVAGQSPTEGLQRQMNAELGVVGLPPGTSAAEQKLNALLDEVNLDGKVTENESTRVAAMRRELGIAEPLDEQEQAFLVRYIEALRDDGVATRDELGADYDAARAAYEKGRNLERLPRGMAAFYDESYLRGLGRLSQVDKQLADLQVAGSPSEIAARRAYAGAGVGLPTVTPAALEAAAQIHPLAAEVLPYAMKRVQMTDGTVEPRGVGERFAARYLQMDANRDFGGLVEAVNKRFPNDPQARRDALAYYGASNYQRDTKSQTLSTGAIRANAPEAVHESVLFMNEVAPPRAAPAPAPVAAPTPAPAVQPEDPPDPFDIPLNVAVPTVETPVWHFAESPVDATVPLTPFPIRPPFYQ